VDLLLYLVFLAVFGLVVGAFGRLALPGPDPMSLGQTMAVGLAGSLIAGLISWGIFGREEGGIALAILFSSGIVYMVRRARGGSLTDPGLRRDERH
jgi:uncharacterized membrane protein YeaQ/YmgE (transglycosylase-associated protein family)